MGKVKLFVTYHYNTNLAFQFPMGKVKLSKEEIEAIENVSIPYGKGKGNKIQNQTLLPKSFNLQWER